MGGSDDTWGDLAAFDGDMADAWDGFDALPDDSLVLNALCEAKHIEVRDLVRLGGRFFKDPQPTLAFSFGRGIKYRDLTNGRRWNYPGSEWPNLHLVEATSPVGASTLIVAEGETDAARLSRLYPEATVGIQAAGAKDVRAASVEQARAFERVFVALDRDEAGTAGWVKWREALPGVVRWLPPDDAEDWGAWEGDTPPPLPDAPTQLAQVVNARDLIALEPPEVISWFDHAILPVGGLMLIHGWVKSFKSFVAFDILSALAQGRDWSGFEPVEEPCTVLALQYEIPFAYYRERVVSMRRHATHPELFDEHYLTWDPIRRPRLTAGDVASEDDVLRALEENGVQVMLVDPIRRLVRGVRAKERDFEQEARVALRFFERCQDLGVTVITTHHDTKGSARTGGGDPLGITGAGAWSGDADTIVSIALPEGHDIQSNQRNMHFTLRNAAPLMPKGVELQPIGDRDSKLLYGDSYLPAEVEEEGSAGI